MGCIRYTDRYCRAKALKLARNPIRSGLIPESASFTIPGAPSKTRRTTVIVQSQAIVLRCAAFQETSKIATLFVREAGKVGVLAKGARSKNSKFLGKLEVGCLLEVIYHAKAGRSLQTLTEASHATDLAAGFDPDRHAVLLALADLLNRLVHEQEAAPELFDLAARVVAWLQEPDNQPLHHFPYVMLRLAECMGVGLRLGPGVPELPDGLHLLQMQDGCVTKWPAGQGMQLSENMARYLACVLHGKRSVRECALSRAENRQLVYALDRYLSYHFEGVAPRSAEILFDSYIDIEVSP